MKKTSPPLHVVFFAARDLQREYFTSLHHHLRCTSKVVWYKDIWAPGLQGLKYLRQANLASIVELKLREKLNTRSESAGSSSNKSFYWQAYAIVRRLGASILFLKYIRFLLKTPCEIVAVWNGNKLRQAIVVRAVECLNRRCVFFENGLLPNTTTLDFKGVNAFNSLPRQRSFYDELSFSEDVDLPSTLVARALEGNRKVITGVNELPKRFIFVPFQVNTDSQITIHSPWINNMGHLYEVVSNVENNMEDKELAFVFKEHPSSAQDYEQLHKNASNTDRLYFANEYSTQELIEKSEAVITINSTVGFESLLLGKRVIVLGDAFYGVEGLARPVKNEHELLNVLNTLNDWKMDEHLRKNYLQYIQQEYAVPESWTNPGVAHWESMNAKFECSRHIDKRFLFMASTPLNLFIACAVALEQKSNSVSGDVRCELCFIDQPGDSAGIYIEAVRSWQESPFVAIHVLPPRSKNLLKKLRNRRRAFCMLRDIIDKLQPEVIATGSDRRVEFQYGMNYSCMAGHNARGTYLDDGTFTYVGRKTRGLSDSWIDNALKKLIYGFWWQQPATVGASGWIDEAYVAFPELVHDALKKKSLQTIRSAWFGSPEFLALSQRLLNAFGVDAELLRSIDVLITLPHASMVVDVSGYAETMRKLVKMLSQQGKVVGIKYHPRQAEPDPLKLVHDDDVLLLPAVLAFEVLLPGLGEAVIVGDVSTTLLSSKWLRPSLRVVAVAGSSNQDQFMELYHSLDIEVISDVSALAGKLRD